MMDVEETHLLWARYRARLYAFVRRRVPDEATAEDLVQDVLVKALARRETLRSQEKMLPWLYQITRHTLVDHYRRARPTEALPEGLADERRSIEEGVHRELARCLAPLVETLPEGYREAIRLVEFENMRQRELAERLGLSLSGAKSRVQRGRRMLEERLFACCVLERDARGTVIDYLPHSEGAKCSC